MSDTPKVPLSESLFGMDEEFSGVLATPSGEAVAGEKIVKEFDFGDGPEKVEAGSQDEILEIISQRIKERNERLEAELLSSPIDEEPMLKPRGYHPVEEPTADHLSVLLSQMSTDPINSIKELVQYSLGIPLEDLRAAYDDVELIKAHVYGNSVGRAFVDKHADEYYPCPENSNKIMKFLEAKNLEPSLQNYDLAFEKLNAIHALKPFPEGYGSPSDKDSEGSEVSTALGSGNSTYFKDQAELNGQEAIERAWSMPLSELEAELRSRSRKRV